MDQERNRRDSVTEVRKKSSEYSDMIVVTGSARTGTSLMMRILKEIGLEVPAPEFFEEDVERMKRFNPQGYYEVPEDQETGIQDHRYKGMAVKLFGYGLEKTPRAFVSKVIVCKRDRAAAVQSSIPVFEALYTDNGKPNHAKGIEDIYYDAHYRFIYQFLEAGTEFLEVSLENMQANPGPEIIRIFNFLGIKPNGAIIHSLVSSVHK